jgi:hypothetical protein
MISNEQKLRNEIKQEQKNLKFTREYIAELKALLKKEESKII